MGNSTSVIKVNNVHQPAENKIIELSDEELHQKIEKHLDEQFSQYGPNDWCEFLKISGECYSQYFIKNKIRINQYRLTLKTENLYKIADKYNRPYIIDVGVGYIYIRFIRFPKNPE
jgi:hypothetical protein